MDELDVFLKSVSCGMQTLAVDEFDVSHVERKQMLTEHKSKVHDKPIEVYLTV